MKARSRFNLAERLFFCLPVEASAEAGDFTRVSPFYGLR